MREPDPRWIALLMSFCTRRPSREEVQAVLSEAFDPDLVLQSGDQLLGDLYFSLLHAATREEDLTPREAAYFLACLQGRREHTWVDKWRFCYGRPYPGDSQLDCTAEEHSLVKRQGADLKAGPGDPQQGEAQPPNR